jgi:pyruvate dehydrogenase E1 component alpha subunit/2-oxoisovalerate dehydrogenase E1 component
MYGIRAFEQSLLDLFATGALAGTTHTCLGQESTAVGVLAALDLDRDIVFSNHRGHGHFLAYGGDVERLYLEVMGKPGGVCDGRGGSQHLRLRNFYSNGVQGGIVPVAVGTAMAEKIAGSGVCTTVFLGDGTLGEGVVYEAFNIASLWSLPVLFVVDDNQYAQSTPRTLQVAGSMPGRLEAFGIDVDEAETTDVEEVRRLACRAVDQIRASGRPRGLILHTYRLGPHSKGDDTRDPQEIRAAWAREPLAIVRPRLDPASTAALEARIDGRVLDARTRALAAPDHARGGGRKPA